MKENDGDPLEWGRLLQETEKLCRTQSGRDLLLRLADSENWAQSPAHARTLQAELFEAQGLLTKEALWSPLHELGDPFPTFERLLKGQVLELAELALVRGWALALEAWATIPPDEVKGELFKKALARLNEPRETLRILSRVLTPEGEISERASPTYHALHGEVRALKRQVEIALDQVIKRGVQDGILQGDYYDVRDGRFVIPVKLGSHRQIEGIFYEASSSGQTVFVEPREVSAVNNQLRQKQNELLEETFRILTETSNALAPFSDELASGAHILSHWDAVSAKGRIGLRFGGKAITVTDTLTFKIQRTAHPLLFWSLKPEEVCRNSLEFSPPKQVLLISGPNTGGKTVFLKTLGLAAVAARTGFPFPAVDQPQVPFFDQVFADLGDPQSIESHLSSFSGHVLKYKRILETIGQAHGSRTKQSLVLLDEVNSATDPEEGGALSRAFLEALMEKNAVVVTTTHDPKLKLLSLEDPRILGASVEFDEASHRPTYRIFPGMIGRSHALDTAERLGFPPEVLTKARSYLSDAQQNLDRLLHQLETKISEVDRFRREARESKLEAEKNETLWKNRAESGLSELFEKTRVRLKKVVEQAQLELRGKLKHADEVKFRQTIEAVFASSTQTLLRSARQEAEESLGDSAVAESLIQASTEKAGLSNALASQEAPQAANQYAVGDRVKIAKWKSEGQVLEIQKDKIKVQMGNMQILVTSDEIEPLAAAPKSRSSSSFKIQGADSGYSPSQEVDLRGLRFEEAMSQLESYLDLCYRSSPLLEVRIIHGLGTGAIREGTQKKLRSLPYILSFRDGVSGEGGSGVTIAAFDR